MRRTLLIALCACGGGSTAGAVAGNRVGGQPFTVGSAILAEGNTSSSFSVVLLEATDGCARLKAESSAPSLTLTLQDQVTKDYAVVDPSMLGGAHDQAIAQFVASQDVRPITFTGGKVTLQAMARGLEAKAQFELTGGPDPVSGWFDATPCP